MHTAWLAHDQVAQPDVRLLAPYSAVDADHEAGLDREAAYRVSRHDRGRGFTYDAGRQTRNDDIVGPDPTEAVDIVVS